MRLRRECADRKEGEKANSYEEPTEQQRQGGVYTIVKGRPKKKDKSMLGARCSGAGLIYLGERSGAREGAAASAQLAPEAAHKAEGLRTVGRV